MLREGEIIVDNFAGGGGASEAIEQALERPVDIAINHDPEAIAMHAANHPRSRHYCQSVWHADPRDVCEGRPVGLAWFSPDCKHFSKAKGGKPVERGIRDLAWVVVRWAATVRPRVIMLENVEEFRDWGPVIEVPGGKVMPDAARKGVTFRSWLKELQRLGYQVEWRDLVASDYGAPTTRKRLFLVARCDGAPIIWPAPTHARPGTGNLLPWATAADCVDWSIPCPSIFDRPRDLVPATCRRLARGIVRFVIEEAQPFILPVPHVGDDRVHSIDRSLLVAAFLAQHNGGMTGHRVNKPLSTITGRGTQQQLVALTLTKFKGTCRDGQPITRPLDTVQAGGQHYGLVAAFLQKYYGTGGQHAPMTEPVHTVTTKARMGLVTVSIGGEPWPLTDIGMRMLTPRELFRAQGFPEHYQIAPLFNGKPLTKTSQISKCGNSVAIHPARALVVAQFPAAHVDAVAA
jgi:DNA (cytosine-5)-methyltransferase 1